MLQVIERNFPKALKTDGWMAKLKEMVPSYGQSLIDNAALCQRVRAETAEILKINNINNEEMENDSSLSVVHRA